MSGHYVKRYASAPARNRAEDNYRWLTMSQGPIPAAAITAALCAYNLAANGHCPLLVPVAWNELMDWAEIHHILTARYAGNGRYPFPWDQARPS